MFSRDLCGQKRRRPSSPASAGHDFAANSRRAIVQDLRKFAAWFAAANAEPFHIGQSDHQGRDRLPRSASPETRAGRGHDQSVPGDVYAASSVGWLTAATLRQPRQSRQGTGRQLLAPKGTEAGHAAAAAGGGIAAGRCGPAAISPYFSIRGCRVRTVRSAPEFHDLMIRRA